jgi:hypothetical protein
LARHRRNQRIPSIALILAGLAAGTAMLAVEQAAAQSVFDTLRGTLNVRRPFGPDAGRGPSFFPFRLFGMTEEAPEEGPYVAYCVRLCDGRYFPLPTNAGAPHSNPAALCGSLCPASATKIYSGTSIERAIGTDGGEYARLANAFVYRTRMVRDCTCNGDDPAGTAAVDIHSDPTLRPGDIVVTRDGPMLFRGGQRAPHRIGDFTPAKDHRGLPAGVREQTGAIRVAPKANPDTAPSPAEKSQAPAAAAQPQSETMGAFSP